MVTGMTEKVIYHLLVRGNAHRLHDCDAFDHAVDARELERFVGDPGHELVFATIYDLVVGFASGTVLRHPDKAPAFFINEVGVDVPWRRRGVARALCRRLIERARAIGCAGIWLATEADNTAARALYRSLSARETRGIVVYDWDGAMDG